MQENQFPDKEKISHQEHSWETDCMARRMSLSAKETKNAEQHEMNSKYLNWYTRSLRKQGFNEKAIKTNDKYFLQLSHCSPCREEPDLRCARMHEAPLLEMHSGLLLKQYKADVCPYHVCLFVLPCLEIPDPIGSAVCTSPG
jgi:hypothetical protein